MSQLTTHGLSGSDDAGLPIVRRDVNDDGYRMVGYIGLNELEHALCSSIAITPLTPFTDLFEALVPEDAEEDIHFHTAFSHNLASSSFSSLQDFNQPTASSLLDPFDFTPYMDQVCNHVTLFICANLNYTSPISGSADFGQQLPDGTGSSDFCQTWCQIYHRDRYGWVMYVSTSTQLLSLTPRILLHRRRCHRQEDVACFPQRPRRKNMTKIPPMSSFPNANPNFSFHILGASTLRMQRSPDHPRTSVGPKWLSDVYPNFWIPIITGHTSLHTLWSSVHLRCTFVTCLTFSMSLLTTLSIASLYFFEAFKFLPMHYILF